MSTIQDEALHLLRKSLGDPAAQFREGQLEAIVTRRDRKRLLVVQRTGWGKARSTSSAPNCFGEVWAPTLIISPLLSLMRNQFLAAARMGIKAVTINSANKEEHATVCTEAVLADQVDVILISPERLANQRFVDDVLLPIAVARIGMLVVDESALHQRLGHDFRPDYWRIVSILKRLPGNLPVLGTTTRPRRTNG